MSQYANYGPLFDSCKIPDICANRHKGNEESQSAFASIKDRLSKSQRIILEYIGKCKDGTTVDEMSEDMHIPPNQISGRVSELKRDGKIYKSGIRLTRSGNKAAVLKAL